MLEQQIEREQFPAELEQKYLAFVKEQLAVRYAEFIGKEIQTAYLESYSEYGQNIFDRYVTYADYWIQDHEYRDTDTGEVFDRAALNRFVGVSVPLVSVAITLISLISWDRTGQSLWWALALAVLGLALNEVFVPILQKQFPEIVDFYLPPEGCSYRMAVVTMKKQYPGHAKRVMLGVWSFLRQFMYTKFVIVTDDDINARDWNDVIWAITTRMDPKRDTVMIDNTPIDYLDFASPVSGLGSKMGLDATHKWPGETSREWGRAIVQDPAVKQRVDELWSQLGID